MQILFCLSLCIPILAQAPSAKEALSMKRALRAVISPDGKNVAYVLSRTNWEDNANESDLYLANIASGSTIKLTAPRKSASAPAWSPDSKSIAFLSNRDGKQQIYLIPIAGGESLQLTDQESGVNSFDWTDPSNIYFLANDSESAALKERKKTYGELSIIEEEYTMSHVWRVKVSDTPKQKAERLSEGNFHVASLAVSPDGKTLAIVTKKNPDLSTLGANLEIVDPANKDRRTLPTHATISPISTGRPTAKRSPIQAPAKSKTAFTPIAILKYAPSPAAPPATSLSTSTSNLKSSIGQVKASSSSPAIRPPPPSTSPIPKPQPFRNSESNPVGR